LTIFGLAPRCNNIEAMEHTASKFGTALAAVVLGIGLPAVAAAQDDSTGAPQQPVLQDAATAVDETTALEMAPLSDVLAATGEQAQALSNMGPISSDNVVAVSLNDLGLTADQRYTLMQQVDPSAEAMLQQALGTAQVVAGGEQRTLADHLTINGVDPASVIAARIDSDGTVTVYYQ
jgi:hypothetical protein